MITAKVFLSFSCPAILKQFGFQSRTASRQKRLFCSEIWTARFLSEKPASDEGYKNVVVELLSRKPKSKALYPDISEFFAGGKDPIRRLFK